MARNAATWCDDCKACGVHLFHADDRKLCARCLFNELLENEVDAKRYRWLVRQSHEKFTYIVDGMMEAEGNTMPTWKCLNCLTVNNGWRITCEHCSQVRLRY